MPNQPNTENTSLSNFMDDMNQTAMNFNSRSSNQSNTGRDFINSLLTRSNTSNQRRNTNVNNDNRNQDNDTKN